MRACQLRAGRYDRFLTALGHGYHFEYIFISSFVGIEEENTQTKSNMLKVRTQHLGGKGSVCVRLLLTGFDTRAAVDAILCQPSRC